MSDADADADASEARTLLVDWMMSCSSGASARAQFLAVGMLDRILSERERHEQLLQHPRVVAATCLVVASKYWDLRPLPVSHAARVAGVPLAVAAQAELDVLAAVDYRMSAPQTLMDVLEDGPLPPGEDGDEGAQPSPMHARPCPVAQYLAELALLDSGRTACRPPDAVAGEIRAAAAGQQPPSPGLVDLHHRFLADVEGNWEVRVRHRAAAVRLEGMLAQDARSRSHARIAQALERCAAVGACGNYDGGFIAHWFHAGAH